MYSFRQVLQNSPEKIKVVVLSVGAVICAAMGLEPNLWETLGIGLAVERLLDLFWVAPINQAKNEAHALTAFENVRLKAARPLRPQKEDEQKAA